MITKQQLPGLNGLRAIAASMVLIGHVYQITGLMGDPQGLRPLPFFTACGDMVNLFFVISGFIITHVLLNEREQTGRISLRKFYIKRALRIWPLYFLLFFAVLIIGATTSYYTNNNYRHFATGSIALITLFLVNLDSFFQFPLSVLPHYWSLSVEEQFYIFWPALFRKISGIRLGVCVIVITILAKVGSDYLAYHGSHRAFWLSFYAFISLSSFSSIAIGALASIFLHRRVRWLKVFYLPVIQAIAWGIFIFSIVARNQMPVVRYINSELMALLYAVIILNVTSNPRTLIKLRGRFWNYIGSISYGIYMYHWPLIPIVYILLKNSALSGLVSTYRLVPLVIFVYALTILIAGLSFKFIELPFLRLKPKSKPLNNPIRFAGQEQLS